MKRKVSNKVGADKRRGQFPAGGEVILFDRSWYNWPGVEHVMGFCTENEYEKFLNVCPMFEKHFVDSGIHLIKYFFDVSQEEQEKRFRARANDPMRHRKLSPMDVKSWQAWWDYSAAYQKMIDATDTEIAPWYRVPADDKRRERLNCISHFLSLFPYPKMDWQPPEFGERKKRKGSAPDEVTFKHTTRLR